MIEILSTTNKMQDGKSYHLISNRDYKTISGEEAQENIVMIQIEEFEELLSKLGAKINSGEQKGVLIPTVEGKPVFDVIFKD